MTDSQTPASPPPEQPAPAAPSCHPEPPASGKVALIGEPLLTQETARILLEAGFSVSLLLEDGEKAWPELESAGRLEIFRGTPDRPAVLEKALAGASALAFLSPFGLDGWLWRNGTHLEDLKRVLDQAAVAGITRCVYLSALAALSPKSRPPCLKDLRAADQAVAKFCATHFILHSAPVMGRSDRLLTAFRSEIQASRACLLVWGYGDTLVQPLHRADLAACIAHCFQDRPRVLAPGAYCLAGPERSSLLDLQAEILQWMGQNRLKLHLPLFCLKIWAALLPGTDSPKRLSFGNRVGLLWAAFGLTEAEQEWEKESPNVAPRWLEPRQLRKIRQAWDELSGPPPQTSALR